MGTNRTESRNTEQEMGSIKVNAKDEVGSCFTFVCVHLKSKYEAPYSMELGMNGIL